MSCAVSVTRVVNPYLCGLISFEGGYVTRFTLCFLIHFLIAVSMLLCCVHFYSDLETLASTPRSVPLTLKAGYLLLCTIVMYWLAETVSALTKVFLIHVYGCVY